MCVDLESISFEELLTEVFVKLDSMRRSKDSML
jgi:hypothetical protein